MTIESDDFLIRKTADKLLMHAGKLTQHDVDVSVAALGVAMMCLARTYDEPRKQINKLLDIIEKEIADAEDSDCQHKWNEDEDGIEVCAHCGEERGEDR